MPILNKDMQVCISLSGRPSNIGTRFHNFLYDELGLNFIYKGFSTTDLAGAIAGIKALGFRGCSVSMPFKEAIIPFIDNMQPSALAIESVNTVVNDGGTLTAYNTDFEAVVTLLRESGMDTSLRVIIRGSGGMGKAVVAAFREVGFGDVTVMARNVQAGSALARKYGYSFVADDQLSLADEATPFDVLVNVTPLGMAGSDESVLAFDRELVERAQVVFDVVAFPIETPLLTLAADLGKTVLNGGEVISLQAGIQFELYTGVPLTADQVARAAAFSRSSERKG
jgi:shikimate dehydrogenase